MTKEEEEEQEADESANDTASATVVAPDAPIDTFGGFKWELIAITKSQYQDFVETLGKREPNEKILRQRIVDEVMPIIDQAEEKQRRKIERRERELLTMEKMATAKRSSRLQDKHDKERQDAERLEADRKRAADLAAAHHEQERQEKMEKDRQSRMLTREQRIKDREYKRLLEEEELARLAEEERRIAAGESRASERRVKDQLQKKKKTLEELAEEDDWTFDCSGCGVYGKNLDDGEHSIACESCSVWQHSKCLGISKAAAEKDNFHFVCADCKRKEEDAKKPKISLKFRAGVSSSPPSSRDGQIAQSPKKPKFEDIEVAKKRPVGRPPSQPVMSNGYAPAQGSPPAQHRPLTYNQQPYGYQPHASSPQFPMYTNGQAYQRPGSSSGSPYVPQNMYAGPQAAYNGVQRAQLPPYSPQPLQNSSKNNTTRPAIQQKTEEQKAKIAQQRAMLQQRQAELLGQPYGQGSSSSTQQTTATHPPYYNDSLHTYPAYPSQHRQSSAPSMARPTSSHSSTKGMSVSPNTQRIPSPVLNRPNMQPTQGNYDTSAITGMTSRSPTMNYHPALFAPSPSPHPQPQATPQQQYSNGAYRQSSLTPAPSGLSPTKHSPPLYASASPGIQAGQRSVSGTPLFPPAEKLAPSPEQLSKEPVPTPMKMDAEIPMPTPSKADVVG